MKTKKLIALLLALLTVGALLVGCNSAETPDTTETESEGGQEAEQQEDLTIGVLVKTMGNPMFREIAYGAIQAGEDFGVEVITLANQQDGDIDGQIKLCEDLIAQGVDALVVTPQHTEGIVTAVEAAKAAGIPFISVDCAVEGAEVDSTLEMGNEQAGYTIGKMVAEKIGGQGNVVIIEGVAGASSSQQRSAGFQRAFAEYPGIEIVAIQNADFAQDKAQQVMADICQAHKDIKAVVTCGDLMALGAEVSLQEAGYQLGGDNGVVIGSFDICAPILDEIKAGNIYVTGYHWSRFYGYWGVEMALRKINGEEIPSYIQTPDSQITAENVDNFIPWAEELEAYQFES